MTNYGKFSYIRQWYPQRPNQDFNHNPWPGNYQYPNANKPIRPLSHNDRSMQRGAIPINQPSNTHLYFQESFPLPI